jgi:predicted nuclease with RNAse H fold
VKFATFIGVDLGGGKGKNTAVARLERRGTGVVVCDYGTLATEPGVRAPRRGASDSAPWYDTALVGWLREHGDAAVGIDAPLSLPACVRCTVPVCPTVARCEVPIVRWMNGRDAEPRKKPKYTPYTQRATEILLHEQYEILPRETLGQGMGPLTARATHLMRALSDVFRLHENLVEVYPKATVSRLFSPKVAARYKRTATSPATRLEILNGLPDLSFAPGAWREDGLANDHKFDAVLAGYTAFLWAEGRCVSAPDDLIKSDGWIYFP